MSKHTTATASAPKTSVTDKVEWNAIIVIV